MARLQTVARRIVQNNRSRNIWHTEHRQLGAMTARSLAAPPAIGISARPVLA
jgi:hypothetical protein